MLSIVLNNLLISILILVILFISAYYLIKKNKNKEIKKNLDQTEGPPDDIYPLF